MMDQTVCTECMQKGPKQPGMPELHSNPRCYFNLGYRTEKETSNALGLSYKPQEALRQPSGYRYDVIDPEFEELMAKIGDYGAKKYGDLNWHKSELVGDKSPINHIRKHLNAYRMSKPYDHFEIGIDRKIHLAAIAFNAMMEFWYETHLRANPTKEETKGNRESRPYPIE